MEYVIVKARQRGNYAANSPSPRALAGGKLPLYLHGFISKYYHNLCNK